jgi:hypothetical protein
MDGLDEPAAPAALGEPSARAVSPGIAAHVSQAEQLFKAGKSRQAVALLWRAEAFARGRREDAAALLELATRYEGHMKRRRQENDLRLLIHNLRGSAARAMPDTPPRSVPMPNEASDYWLAWVFAIGFMILILIVIGFVLLYNSLKPS